MYQYPYGDTQQLNLDWILTKIKELEQQSGSGGSSIEEVANALISATYNAATQYRRYDYCYLNEKLYRCLSDTTGAFNPADWQEVLLGDDIPILTRLINAVDASLTSLQGTVADLDSDDIDNASGSVPGATVSNALTNLNNTDTAIESSLAIVSDNNTHPAITSGQYVYIKNHSTLTEGIYKATAAILINGTLSNANVSLIVGGAFNQITPIELGGTGESTILAAAAAFRQALTVTVSVPANSSVKLSLSGVTTLFYAYIGSSPTTCSVIIITGYSGHTNLLTIYPAQTEGNIRFTQGSGYVTISNADVSNARNVTFNVLTGLPSNVVIS